MKKIILTLAATVALSAQAACPLVITEGAVPGSFSDDYSMNNPAVVNLDNAVAYVTNGANLRILGETNVTIRFDSPKVAQKWLSKLIDKLEQCK